MTIALGLLARDGVVMAADTQETAGVWKHSRGKLSLFGRRVESTELEFGTCVISGSGPSLYIDEARARLMGAFGRANAQTAKAALEAATVAFFNDKVLPVSSTVEQRPWVSLVVALAYPKGKTALYLSQDNLFVEQSIYAAIGIGADLAHSILSRYCRVPLLDVPQAILLTAYVMAQVKNSVEGCGKDTDLYFIRHGIPGVLSRRETQELETAMDHYASEAEPWAFREVIGQSWPDGKGPAKQARATVRRLLSRLLIKKRNK